MKFPLAVPRAWDMLCRYRQWLLGGLAAVAAVDVVWLTITYFVYPGYLDHGEPSVTLISWRLLDGIPAFQDFDEPGRVGNVYGPMSYAVHAVVFALVGPTVAAGKAASLLAATLIPVVVWFGQRHRGREAAVLGGVIAAGLVLLYLPASIWNRPDSFIALLVAVAVAAANSSRDDRADWVKSVIIAVAGGIAVGMKLHAGVYFVPVAIYHCVNSHRGVKTLLAIAAVGLATVLLPFSFEVFPLDAFLSWIGRHVGKPSPIIVVLTVARYGIIFLVPVAFHLAARRWSTATTPAGEKAYISAYVACLLLLAFPATKAGAGTHYFLPFAAVFADLILRQVPRFRKRASRALLASTAAALAILIISIPVQKRFFRALHWQHDQAVAAEISRIMGQYPDRTIEMGIGDDVRTYRRTFLRTVLVFEGHPYTIESAPTMEATNMGIPLSDVTLALIRGCSTDIWLIPKGERPFAMIGYYGSPTVEAAFIDAFHGSYAKAKSFEYFDVWACNH